MTDFGAVPSDDTIPESAIAPGSAAVPVGTILDWFPPASATAPYTSVLPANWVVCAGQAWTSVNSALATAYGSGTTNDLGFTSGNVPDLVGRVTYGAATSVARNTNATHNTGNATQANAGVGGTVGTNVGPNHRHAHASPQHSHAMDHYHFVGMPVKGDFRPTTQSGTPGNELGYVINNTVTSTGAATATSSFTPGTRNSTDNNAAANTGDGGPGGTNDYYPDNRPAGVGVLKIMKVKYV